MAWVIEQVCVQHLSYLRSNALRELAQVALDNEKLGLDGLIIEAGCALGGSTLTLTSAKNQERSFYVYDVFDMIPPPSERDGGDVHNHYQTIKTGRAKGLGDNLYYGYQENLYDKVQQTFKDFGYPTAEHNVHLVQGLFKDTIKVESPVSLVHIDSDWYESVLTCLIRIEPHVVSGGTIIVDDYFHWSGCKTAVDEYFLDRREEYSFVNKQRLHIIKK